VSARTWLLTAAAALAFLAGPALADKKPTAKETISFGQLQSPSVDTARAQALDWLKAAGKSDADTLKAFEAIWAQTDRTLLERVADTLVLGDADAAKVMAEARDPAQPAPTAIPGLLKDTKKPAFLRSNLALAYAKALTKRRVYEEALDALKVAKPEQVVEPAGYLFHRAVAEHALLLKDDAIRSIARLLEDGADAPDRYRLVGMLMAVDMQAWKDKDLGTISRLMDNVERRLELGRGGPQTQKTQKQIVARLDELIKEIENQCKGSSQCNGGGCPNGGQPGQKPGAQGPNPQQDSFGGNNSGKGEVDKKKFEQLAKQWGKLPDKERIQAMQELTRDLPAEYRELIESYFRKLAQSETKP
jgi:hypothetical protein